MKQATKPIVIVSLDISTDNFDKYSGTIQTEWDSMPDKVLEELAEWVDPGAIAEAILQELESQEVEPTVANGQKVWLDVLENEFPDGLRSSVKPIF